MQQHLTQNRLGLLWFVLPVLVGAVVLLLVVRDSPFSPNRDNGDSFAPAISADGRYVIFSSFDSGLAPDGAETCSPDDFNCWHVYVKDTQTGDVRLVFTENRDESATSSSSTPAGVVLDAYGPVPDAVIFGSSYGSPVFATAAISGDGRFAVFSSAGDSDTGGTLFRKDLTGEDLVSVLEGSTLRNMTVNTSVSADGRLVSFWTTASLVEEDGNDDPDLYIRDLETGSLELVSIDPPGSDRIGFSKGIMPYHAASLSADGRLVVFSVDRLLPVYKNPRFDVFLKDRETGGIRLVSESSAGQAGDSDSQAATISDDGRYVVFQSRATNLTGEEICAGGSGSCLNVYLKDLDSGEVRLVSKDSAGSALNNAGSPVISGDGRYIAFVTVRFEGFDNNDRREMRLPPYIDTIHVVDARSGESISVFPGDGGGVAAVDAGDAIGSTASPGGAVVAGPSAAPPGAGLIGSQGMDISGDGRYLVFPAYASSLGEEDRMCEPRYGGSGESFINIAPPPQLACTEIYRKDVVTGEISRISAEAG